MRPTTKQSSERAAFTIIEILTVMSVIIILFGLLVPALHLVKRHAKRVKQNAQFHSIGIALDLFNNLWEGYPDSDELDENGQPYCGAMRLCEAMMGQDLLGFHPDSHFRSDCTMGGVTPIYSTPTNGYAPTADNLGAREGPYLPLDNANAYRLEDLYGAAGVGSFVKDLFVLCDEFPHTRNRTTGKRIGMPILYYKANVSRTRHSVSVPFHAPTISNGVAINDPDNIYDYMDNDSLVQLGMPWTSATAVHLMDSQGLATLHDAPLTTSSAQVFYNKIWNDKITITPGRPYRPDSYILLSAGFDGEYGTRDDVFNFGN